MHGYKSQGQEKIKDAFLLLSTGMTFSNRNSTRAPDFLLPPSFMPRYRRALRAACHVFYMMPSLQTVQ